MAVLNDLPIELIDYILESEMPTVAWTIGDSRTDCGGPGSQTAAADTARAAELKSQLPTPHLENEALRDYFGPGTPRSSFLDAIEDASPLQALLEACRGISEGQTARAGGRELPQTPYNKDKRNILTLRLTRTKTFKDRAYASKWRISRHGRLLVLTASNLYGDESSVRNELAAAAYEAPVGLLTMSFDCSVLWVNKEWLKVTGMYGQEDHDRWGERVSGLDFQRGPRVDEFTAEIEPEDIPLVTKYRDQIIAHHQRDSCEFRWLPSGGDDSENWTVSTVAPLCNEDGKPYAMVGSLTNVAKFKVDELHFLRQKEESARAKLVAEQAVVALSVENEALARKAAEDAEERATEAVQEKQATELFLDVASHELRNPISAILQNAELTRSSMDGLYASMLRLEKKNQLPLCFTRKKIEQIEENIEACDAIIQCGHAQERIANDTLGLAQIQLSKYTIASIEFDLIASLRNICRMWKSECKAKGIKLELSLGNSLKRLGSHARVLADPTLRFTAKSAVRKVVLSVEVSGQPPDRGGQIVPPAETEYYIEKQRPVYLFFSVADTGPGMTEEETSRLFEKFMQAFPFTHSTMGGSGLGLWIARNLCELQAGRIEVRSKVGEGSIFRCFITARSIDAGATEAEADGVPIIEGITEAGPNGQVSRIKLDNDPCLPGAEGHPEQTVLPLAGKTILCCEDNQINRTVLRKQLLKAGAERVLLAENGQEGLELLHLHGAKIACIIMDYEMPVMDGLGATRAIRAVEERDKSRKMRIVGLTGNAREAQIKMGLQAGMDDVVTKPYKVPDLMKRISV
ncbi:BZ3500_MvSof-1268-A1-R1_Chr7-3g09652 [Microbotryum saponariae]|uniref:histidine kinase n=1 Tax=Microbotryum saponariae TaxID=289078 RepID=A0A2X0LBB4_9BASI|nr:BZ3501_MvSof-1269-A2-R1_Chr7-2g09375 [Microbotryum saponariae]SDA02350.1 BZ3500_MvSof-1268-A1-R1_Chr7-3g09652 [Microbotryum saponariae]